jgi:hypothetical protein
MVKLALRTHPKNPLFIVIVTHLSAFICVYLRLKKPLTFSPSPLRAQKQTFSKPEPALPLLPRFELADPIREDRIPDLTECL